jgi:hypothetical protein
METGATPCRRRHNLWCCYYEVCSQKALLEAAGMAPLVGFREVT